MERKVNYEGGLYKMDSFGQFIQIGDWKGEKHVPVIHAPETVKAGEAFDVKVSIGDAVPHPNTFEHHIEWIKLFYLPEDGKFPVHMATFDFRAHGEGNAFTEPAGLANIKLEKSGTLYALSYCNIHGLWGNSVKITIE